MTDVIPDFTEKYYDFEMKFGKLFYLAPDCILLCYECKSDNKTYQITGDVTKDEFENLYKKSIEDNKDYVLEYVKKNGKEINTAKDNGVVLDEVY